MVRPRGPSEEGRSRTYYLRVCFKGWTPLERVMGIEPTGVGLEGRFLTIEETPAFGTSAGNRTRLGKLGATQGRRHFP